MITFQKELLCEMAAEVDALLELHYDELTLDKDVVKLAPMWEEYAALERVDRFVVFTARDGAALVGYAAFFVVRHLHYGANTIAVNDVLFLHKDHRKGLNAARYIKYCEAQVRAMSAQKITWASKLNKALVVILKRMGYAEEDVIMGKKL